MKPKYIVFIFLLLNILPSYSQKAGRNEKQTLQREKLEMLLNSRKFFFRGSTALPSRGSAIDLTTHRSFVRFDPGEIESFMPFFGQAYSGVGFNDPGLHFKGRADNFEVEKRKRNYLVTVKVRGEYDSYTLYMTVTPDGNANLSISSNNREEMSYYGEIVERLD